MQVYEITVRIYLPENIKVSDMQGAISHFIDSYLNKNEVFSKFHQENVPKCYTMDLPYPIEKGMYEYKGDSIYQFRIRTIKEELSSYLLSGIAKHSTEEIKGLVRTVKVIPHKHIASIFSLTPVVLINAEGKGYWRDIMTFSEYEEMLKKSIIHQYEVCTGERVDQDCMLYDQIELKNKCAIGISYKGIKLLGDKLSMRISDNDTAQRIAYYLLGSGLGSKGSRGFGFLGYKFL